MSVAVPGFVDIQVNGGYGLDFTSDPASIWEVGRRLPEQGVTAFVPTIITSSPAAPIEALEVLAAGPPAGWIGARPLGIHLEGPMISPDKRGTHPVDLLVAATVDLVDAWVAAGPPLMVTVAPEIDGAPAAIKALREAGTVVSLGHSACTATQARDAFERGASNVTHLFNGMSGLDHRSPGLAAAAMVDDDVTVGLISDGVHVDPVMLSLAYRVLGPGRIALVTDAVAAQGMDSGRYRIGDVEVTVDGFVSRNADGALAGGVAPMDHLLRTVIAATGCTLDEAVDMASTTPARVVGYPTDPSDQVTLDDDLEVLSTAIGGQVVFRR